MSVSIAPAGPDLVLCELFLEDTRGNASALSEGLDKLASSAEPAPVLAGLVMNAQAIKGAARIIEFAAAISIAEELETSFQRLETGELTLTPGLSKALGVGAALLEEIASLAPAALVTWTQSAGERVRQILNAIKSGTIAERPSRPPASETTKTAALGGARKIVSMVPSADPAILELFHTEAEACTATLSRGLVELESGGAAELEDLMRAAHSIKGAARIVGIGMAARVAHAMEECFVAAQQGRITLSGAYVDELLKAVDVLAEIARCSSAGTPGWQTQQRDKADELAERLQRLASGGSVPSDASRSREPTTGSSEAAPPKPLVNAVATPSTALESKTTALAFEAGPQDRVVRVTAQSINRLMGLAGECLVESRRVRSLGASMQRLKRRQAELTDTLNSLERRNHTALDVETPTIIANAKSRALECRTLLTEQIEELDSYARRMDDLSERLYREALKSRMRPFGDCVHGFPRMVRDLGRQLGKQVRLQVLGESTDVDRDVLESLEAPLNHLLRNASDHGIEAPDERMAAGKPAQGTIRLEARHHAGMLAITVSDDGRGIDPERLRSKIVERALLAPNVAQNLCAPELMEFIFLPGFSTASVVSEISGRGVGLDAVRSAVEAASGMVKVVSEPGRGTTFHLQLPVTRSVMRALVSEVSGEAYAFPLLRIQRILHIAASSVNTLGSAQYFVLGDANISLVSAQQILGIGVPATSVDELCIVIVGDKTHRYGVIVDKFLGEHDLVVRSLDSRLGKVQDVAAAAILVDGSPALILDVDDVLRSIEKLALSGRVDKLSARKVTLDDRPRRRVLVVDDSITVREAERQLLVNHGYDVDVAVDGVDGWNSLRNAHYDLVVSDVDMPRMNGIELVRTVRQDPKLSAMPIVIVSYKDREEDRLRGLDAGANYYLTKSSFHDETLVHAVEELIGSASS